VKIKEVLLVAQAGSFPNDDAEAIRDGAQRDGYFYVGTPRSAGYRRVRQASQSLGVLLVLEDGTVAAGDGVSVQYSGTGGREPVLDADAAVAAHTGAVRDAFTGADVSSFRASSERLDALALPAPVAYGVSQALLVAAARAARRTVAEQVAVEYGTALQPVPVFAQCGEDRHDGVDRMILRRVDELPHGLINHARLVGEDGGELERYVAWIRDRILAHRDGPDYAPTLHLDTYGTIGAVFGSLERCAAYITRLGEVAAPFALRIEQPVHAASRAEQIEVLVTLRRLVEGVELIADEWCNTLEDVQAFAQAGAGHMLQVKLPDVGGLDGSIRSLLACREAGLLAYCGGSCTETEQAARVAVGVAMGAGADVMLARPGMGVDEAVMVTRNEMQRTLALAGR
jgi:methylaspartate ammonia-lyase